MNLQNEHKENLLFTFIMSDLKEIVISYPSIEEQTKISSMFENLDNLITLHQRKLEKLKNIKKACLEKMFV
ncbi:MAG: restriction endonuclease subunit S [Peptococcia bacterium]